MAHLREALEADVLDRVREAPPSFLEQVIVDLLIAMGYGGGDTARGRVTGRSGDGGIDGTIREDALGLDEVGAAEGVVAHHRLDAGAAAASSCLTVGPVQVAAWTETRGLREKVAGCWRETAAQWC